MDAAYEAAGQRGNWFFATFLSRRESPALLSRMSIRSAGSPRVIHARARQLHGRTRRAEGQDGLVVLRMRPSWTTDTTRLPFWKTWPLARPRAPNADGDSCE